MDVGRLYLRTNAFAYGWLAMVVANMEWGPVGRLSFPWNALLVSVPLWLMSLFNAGLYLKLFSVPAGQTAIPPLHWRGLLLRVVLVGFCMGILGYLVIFFMWTLLVLDLGFLLHFFIKHRSTRWSIREAP